MRINDDGSMTVEPGDTLTSGFLKKWKQDMDNPAVFRLRWPDCPRRELKVLLKPCGKRVTDYHCNLKQIGVSPSICEQCLKEGVRH